MARYGSEKIRGHGIPEAMEAVLIGRSRMSAKVALLKPLSSAISIGTGGPFGAEGPIIMTGGALGSLFNGSARHRKVAGSRTKRPTRLLGYLGRSGIAAGWRFLFEEEQVQDTGWPSRPLQRRTAVPAEEKEQRS
jgi:H+/Cl- antiporter ClcA